jgi:acyl dehydratase
VTGEATTWLDAPPPLPRVYARAAAGARSRRPRTLPPSRLGLRLPDAGRDRLAGYDRVCGFRLSDEVPPTWPHVLGFPLQMALMARRDFPFALPGVVHLRNVVVWAGPLRTDSALEVEVHAEALAAHPKGTTVDLVTQVRAADEPVWWGRSTYLSRGRAAVDTGDAAPAPASVEVDERQRALWRVPADIGRRYARVSGDINPIHQNALAAKAFGFPAAIAHGMWLQARLLSSYGPTLPLAGGCDVAFRSPVLLPSSVRLHDRAVAPGAWDVELRSVAGRVHLSGSIRPA